MRKIRLSDTDFELFDVEIGYDNFTFYQKHKDAFKTMWREQGKPFWTRFQITFRSFTVKHGVIKHMNIDSPKFQNILDEAFIFIHEQFVDGKESTARNFIDDIARLAQNQDKFPALDSKSFSKDPFFTRDTRELFRKFFGTPDQKATYLKVYILCPVYLRFGGSVCQCLIRWTVAELMSDPTDDSYWTPPQSQATSENTPDETIETTMCSKCIDECGTKYFHERIMGNDKEPVSLQFWTKGDPRFNDSENPLFAPHMDPNDDWRNGLSADMFRDFYNYAKFKYGDGCRGCTRLKKKRDKVIHVCKASRRKKKQIKLDQECVIQDLRDNDCNDGTDKNPEYEELKEMIKEKSRLKVEKETIKMIEKLQTERLKELEAEHLKEEIKRQCYANHERQKDIESARLKLLREERSVRQVRTVRMCKHLANDEKAIAFAEELDRRNRERSPNDGPPKCTCYHGKPTITKIGDNGMIRICHKKAITEIGDNSSDSSVSGSTSSASSRDSSVDKNVEADDTNTSGDINIDNKNEKVADNTKNNSSVNDDSNAGITVNKTMIPNLNADDIIEEMFNVVERLTDDQTEKTDEKSDAVSEMDKFPIQEVAGRDIEDENMVSITETKENIKADSDLTKIDGENVKNDNDEVKEDDKFPIQEEGDQDKPDIQSGSEPNARVSDEEIKSSVKCDHDVEIDTCKKDNVTGFKVIKIEDQKNNLYEVNVSVACVKPGVVREDNPEEEERKKETLRQQELNNCIISSLFLRENIPGLPQRLEWWEGRGFAVAVVNYEDEEKELCKHWTNFTLKINGFDEIIIKKTMIQLLMYVSKRKRRESYGWNMEVDDIVACILPEDSEPLEDLSISVCRGFRFEDRLTDYERSSLLTHYPNLNLDIVLCGIEEGSIVKTLETKSGKDKLRKIIDYVADKDIITGDLPLVNTEKLSKKLNKDTVTKADILWEQMIRKPEKFELFALLDKEYVLSQTDWWELGMRNKDIRMFNSTKEDLPKICPTCKTVGLKCHCEKPSSDVGPRIRELVEHTDYDKVKILGDENGPDLGKMKYTETNLNMDNKNDKMTKKQAKANRKKEKRIELKDLPARFAEVGLDADKTMITIPSNDKEPMLKRVPIPGTDKSESMAPIPGVHSSLNFTFQNGKREQTINVTLGAYLPEEKITALQDQRELIKLIEKESKRQDQLASSLAENVSNSKKDKKKKKKKNNKTSSVEMSETAKLLNKDNNELTAKFLEELFCDEEKVKAVKKQMNQHMGITNKIVMGENVRPEMFLDESFIPKCTCPGHDAIFEMVKKRPLPTNIEEKDKLIQEALGISEVVSKKGRKKITQIQIKDTINKCECGKCEVEAIETFGIQPAVKKEVKKTKKMNIAEAILKSRNAQSEVGKVTVDSIPDKDVDVIKETSESNDSKKACKRASKKEKENDTSVNSDGMRDGSSDESQTDGTLRTCGHCQKIEPTKKTFKKCQKCKDEGVLDVRYYCSRECQLDDWKLKHKLEHKDGLLG